MAHKNFFKICFVLLAIFTTLVPNMTFAAVTGISCEELNDPKKTKDWIITVLEEQFTGKDKSDTFKDTEMAVKDCLRVTDIAKSSSQYKSLGACPADAKCQRVQVLMAKSGTALLYGYIGFIYRWAAGTIGMVCVGMLVYYGTRIAAAGDNAGVIDEAKQHIMQSLGGLILLFLSAVILYTINPNFFVI